MGTWSQWGESHSVASVGLSVSLCVTERVGLGGGAGEKGSNKHSLRLWFLPAVVSSSCHSMAPGLPSVCGGVVVWWHSDPSAALRVIPTRPHPLSAWWEFP